MHPCRSPSDPIPRSRTCGNGKLFMSSCGAGGVPEGSFGFGAAAAIPRSEVPLLSARARDMAAPSSRTARPCRRPHGASRLVPPVPCGPCHRASLVQQSRATVSGNPSCAPPGHHVPLRAARSCNAIALMPCSPPARRSLGMRSPKPPGPGGAAPQGPAGAAQFAGSPPPSKAHAARPDPCPEPPLVLASASRLSSRASATKRSAVVERCPLPFPAPAAR